MSSPCLIPSNPDVAGIGVRAAIYAQNILCFVPAVWAIWDGQVTEYELDSVETQSTTNLVLAFAILISCIVQAFTLGLTNYHASIILSMSWINNTSVFVYFLMCVHHKADGREPVKLRWSVWWSYFRSKLGAVIHPAEEARGQSGEEGAHPVNAQQDSAETTRIKADEAQQTDVEAAQSEKAQQDSAGKEGSAVKIIFRRVALLFGSLHLTLMAALGLWLWSKPQAFGKTDSACATEFASIAILGAHVPFGSNALRIFSLAFYSVFLLPGFNLLIPMLVFLSIFICHDKFIRHSSYGTSIDRWGQSRQTQRNLREFERHLEKLGSKYSSERHFSIPHWLRFAFPRPLDLLSRFCDRGIATQLSTAFPVWVGLVFLLAINIVFIADIELTLHRNRALQASGEAEWGFGQVLAILLLFMPLRDLVEMVVSRRQKVMATDELRKAIHKKDVVRIQALVRAGADPNAKAADDSTALEAVIVHRKDGLAFLPGLIEAGVNLDARFSDGRTALEVAAQKGYIDFLKALINAHIDLEVKFPDGHTALEVVALEGHKDCLRALIDARVDLEAQFSDGRTAFEVACTAGHEDCAVALLEAGVQFQAKFTDGRTALEAVVKAGWWLNLYLLGKAGVDLEAQFSDGLTALEVVTAAGDEQCLRQLLISGVNIETKFSDGRTALEVASLLGHERCVGLLNHVAAGNPASQWEIPFDIPPGWPLPQPLP